MKKINIGSNIKIYWKIWRGANKVTEDFNSMNTNLKVFLVGSGDTYYLEPSINNTIDPGYDVIELDIPSFRLGVGAYNIKAIWEKNGGRNVLTSSRAAVLYLTDSPSEAPIQDEEVRIVSLVESFGRDGMSAYETAVMRGVNEGITSEIEWVKSVSIFNERKRMANEEERISNEDDRMANEAERHEAERRRERFKDGLIEKVNEYKPIVINGDVTNAPDEEDITSEGGLLKFKNRPAFNEGYGRGYFILRRNIPIDQQLVNSNTIYEIRDDFDLTGKTINIPKDCILRYNGGSFFSVSGVGTIVCDNTIIEGVDDRNNYVEYTGSYEYAVDDRIAHVVDPIITTRLIPLEGTVVELDDKSDRLETRIEQSEMNIATLQEGEYRSPNNAMGYKVLQSGLSIQSQIKEENTIYEVRYLFIVGDIDSSGAIEGELKMPSNCILKFNGGKIINGCIELNDTLLECDGFNFENIIFTGTCKNTKLNIRNFGAIGDGKTDDAPAIRMALSIIDNNGGGTLYIPKGTYYLNSGDENIEAWGKTGFACFTICDNLEVVGDGDDSVLINETNRFNDYPDGGYIRCGRVFAALEGKSNRKLKGKIHFHNFKIEYTKATGSPEEGYDYTDGHAIQIYRNYNSFCEDFEDLSVIVEDMSFINLVGHQSVNCCGAKTFVARNNTHRGVGKTTDPTNRDYSVYYTNVDNGVFHGNIFNTRATSIESHNVHDNIYGNIFEWTGTAFIFTGDMFDAKGGVRSSIHRFYDNILYHVERYVLAPFYYSNTKIGYVESFNNHVVLNSADGVTRYIFPQTDNASSGTNYIGIDKVYIHDEYIRQDSAYDTPASIWSRIFRNTDIENLIIENCYMKDLHVFPLLIADNHNCNTMKSVVFSGNTLVNCGLKLQLEDNTSDNNIMATRSVVASQILSPYNGRNISIKIEGNRLYNLNELATIFSLYVRSSENNPNNVVDVDVSVRENTGSRLKYPIGIVRHNYGDMSAPTIKKDAFDVDVEFYDDGISSLVIFVNDKFGHDTFKASSKLRFVYNTNPYEYYDIVYDYKGYNIEGFASNTSRNIGYVPSGAVIKSNVYPREYYYTIEGSLSPKWISNIRPMFAEAELPNASAENAGFGFYNSTKEIPVWMKSNKYVAADGFNASYRRKGEEDLRPSLEDLTTSDIGLSYYNTTKKRIEYYNGVTWTDAAGNDIVNIE